MRMIVATAFSVAMLGATNAYSSQLDQTAYCKAFSDYSEKLRPHFAFQEKADKTVKEEDAVNDPRSNWHRTITKIQQNFAARMESFDSQRVKGFVGTISKIQIHDYGGSKPAQIEPLEIAVCQAAEPFLEDSAGAPRIRSLGDTIHIRTADFLEGASPIGRQLLEQNFKSGDTVVVAGRISGSELELTSIKKK